MDNLSMFNIKKVEAERGTQSEGKTHFLDLTITKESGARVLITLFSKKYIPLNFAKNSKKKGQ